MWFKTIIVWFFQLFKSDEDLERDRIENIRRRRQFRHEIYNQMENRD